MNETEKDAALLAVRSNVGLDMNDKELKRYCDDLLIYGTCVKIVYQRAWYNPMRWIKGEFHQKRINPKDMYV